MASGHARQQREDRQSDAVADWIGIQQRAGKRYKLVEVIV